MDGYVRLEHLSWDAYNESTNFIELIERYFQRFGKYPKRVLVDKLYRNRDNLRYCKKNGIKVSGPRLGRPKKDEVVDKSIQYQDNCDRNVVEGKFGESKIAYGLDRVVAKLKETSITVIQIALITMNLSHLLRQMD